MPENQSFKNPNPITNTELNAKAGHEVFVVMRIRHHGWDQVVGVTKSLDAAAKLVMEDGDFWDDRGPVDVADRESWFPFFRWEDENRNWNDQRFQNGHGVLEAHWHEGWTEYKVQWSEISE